MSTVETGSTIVVGVPGEGHLSEGTVGLVVETAIQLGLGVELVHVVPTLVGGPTGAWEAGTSLVQLRTEGQAALDAASSQVRERVGGRVPVSAELVRGSVVTELTRRSRRAELVVLQRRHLDRWERLSAGSVTGGVAARAHCPVISVPSGWTPPRRPLPITVGVEDAKRADAELWTALGLAAAMDVPVQAVRATWLPEPYQEILRRGANEDDFLRLAREELVRDANLPESVCERVPCVFEVRWGRPATVLVDASAGSSLVVVARRDPILPFGSHLGPVVRELLRDAECPVMVVEPALSEQVVATSGSGILAATG
jgi:nucleotide-binding universal stress UspA family protein